MVVALSGVVVENFWFPILLEVIHIEIVDKGVARKVSRK